VSAEPNVYAPSVAERCLDALEALGGEATTGQVHALVNASGFPVPHDQVSARLHALAWRMPPGVTRLGQTPGGPLWRLGPPERTEVAEPEARHRGEPAEETFGRLTCCPRCGFLRDALGHVWACLAPGGRLRRRLDGAA
jgi:hypothetical protein